MFKSFLKGLFFDFDQISHLVTGNYEDMISSFSNEELYFFSLKSQNRVEEIKVFLSNHFGKDFYTDELNKEINFMVHNVNLDNVNSELIGNFQGKQNIDRWNLLTASFDYVKQFIGDDGVDSAFFYKLYKASLEKSNLRPLEML